MRARRLILLLVVAVASFGADLSGTWSGTMTPEGEKGSDKFQLVLRQTGETVTGTIGPNESDRQAVQKLVIQEDRVTFEIAVPGRLMTFDLVVQGENISGRMELKMGDRIRRATIAATRSR